MRTVWTIPWKAIPTAKKRQRHSGETSPQDEDFSYSQVDVADRMLRWEKPSGDRGWNLTNEKLIRDRYVS